VIVSACLYGVLQQMPGRSGKSIRDGLEGAGVWRDSRPLERRVANDSRETDTQGQKSAQLTELRISPTYPGVEVSRGVDTGATSGQTPAPSIR